MAAKIPAVDAYIERSQPFAQPILTHLREVIHEGAPDAVEAIKWSRPFFLLQGTNGEVILGNISAFKAHCSFGLWGTEMAQQLRADGVASSEGMGTFGKIGSIADLPPRRKLLTYVKEAARKIAEGERTASIERPRTRVAKPEAKIPEALAAALKNNKAAGKKFETMTPGCRREYCAWIADAKQDATRERRAAQAAEWIAEGKNRNWKYENC